MSGAHSDTHRLHQEVCCVAGKGTAERMLTYVSELRHHMSKNHSVVETVLGTVETVVGTVVETVANYIETVRFLS